MGFDCGFYVYPKYSGIDSSEKLFGVEHAVEYKMNEWLQEHYSYEDWMGEVRYPPTEEQISFYISHMQEDEFHNKHIWKCINCWCSDGKTFHNDIVKILRISRDDLFNCEATLLNKDDVIKILDYAWNKIKQFLPEPCCLEHSFKVMPYYNNEFDTEPDILLSNCSGIEVEFPDSTVKRIYASDEYDFMASKESVDEDVYWAFINLINTCVLILKEVDFDNEFLEYSGGW